MRYMPYTTHHVYSLLTIENAAFLAYLWYTYSIIAHDTRQLNFFFLMYFIIIIIIIYS